MNATTAPVRSHTGKNVGVRSLGRQKRLGRKRIRKILNEPLRIRVCYFGESRLGGHEQHSEFEKSLKPSFDVTTTWSLVVARRSEWRPDSQVWRPSMTDSNDITGHRGTSFYVLAGNRLLHLRPELTPASP